MKKVLAVVMALVMAFAFCVPSFAETTGSAGGGIDLDSIMDTITGVIGKILGGFGSSGSSGSGMDIGSIIEFLRGFIGGGGDTTSPTGGAQFGEISAADAKNIVNALLRSGAKKADIQKAVDKMYADGQLSDASYKNLCDAIEAAEDVTGTPGISDEDAAKAAASIIIALKKLGVPNDQLKSVVDKLYENGTIPQNVYDEIIKQLDSSEATTDASNAGGIGGFLGNIVDKLKDAFGSGGKGDNSGNGSTTKPGSYEGKEPTGDTAILSVAAVAAVAGVALVLTKKKQK